MAFRFFVFLCGICVLSSLVLAAGSTPRRSLLVRVDSVGRDDLLKSGVIMPGEEGPTGIFSLIRDTAMAIVSRTEYELLRERGFRCSILLEDSSELQLMKRAAYGPTLRLEPPYHNYASMLREIDSLQTLFPTILHKFSIGRTMQGGQPIFACKISRDVQAETDRPAILLNGCHHANELLGGEICLAAVHELVSRYGKDPEITRWVNKWQIFVVPVVNVDGHDVVTSGHDPRWRKSKHNPLTNGEAEYPFGVDLNRNYDFNWAHGGSGEPSSDRFRGPFPFSESEPRAIAALARQQRFLLSVTYHSSGEVIYYPWDWKGHKAPDDHVLTQVARGLAGSIRTMRGDTCYKAEHGAGLVGQSYPWLYGTLGTFDFIVETGAWASIFPPYEVPGIVRANIAGLRYMLGRIDGPGLVLHVKDAVTGSPLEAEVWFPVIETEEVHRRTSDPGFGVIRHLLVPGKHTCIVAKAGYQTVVLQDIEVGVAGWVLKDVLLQKESR
jgi:hypothetical protein